MKTPLTWAQIALIIAVMTAANCIKFPKGVNHKTKKHEQKDTRCN